MPSEVTPPSEQVERGRLRGMGTSEVACPLGGSGGMNLFPNPVRRCSAMMSRCRKDGVTLEAVAADFGINADSDLQLGTRGRRSGQDDVLRD